MWKPVHAALRFGRLRPTVLRHGLPPQLSQGTAAFPANRLVRWAIAATTLLEQAEGLIASLPLDQRRRLIERLLANMPPDDPESEPALPLELTTAAPKNEPDGFVKFSISVTKTKTEP